MFSIPSPVWRHLVAEVQHILQVLAHAVVLDGEEDCVEDDAERHDHVEQRVVDDGVEDVLGLQPARVVQAAGLAAGAVAVVAGFWN